MQSIVFFNNKGGVGKTTLAYHFANILAQPEDEGGLGKKVLMIDLDPQCNLTILSMNQQEIKKLWDEEIDFIRDFKSAKQEQNEEAFVKLIQKPRSIHFVLKPIEDGLDDWNNVLIPPPVQFNHNDNLGLLPGRLTLHSFENQLSERFNGLYANAPISTNTYSAIRNVCEAYSKEYQYDYVVIDVAPSLGVLNKVILSTADSFVVPCSPDIFSAYGVKNIGEYLNEWKSEFDTLLHLSQKKNSKFLKGAEFVKFLGYTFFNARKYRNVSNKYNLASTHSEMVDELKKSIKSISCPKNLESEIQESIGGDATMHSYNTMIGLSQFLNLPLWYVPEYTKFGHIIHSKNRIAAINGAKAQNKWADSLIDFKNTAKAIITRLNKISNNQTAH